jgi:hypothetical protein
VRRAATVAVVALEPIQLRGEPLGSPLLVVRGGVNALADDLVRKACLLSRNKWGFDGISVFEAPDGNLEELSRRNQAIAERQRIRTAFGQAVRHAGFPVLDTAGPLHWTIVLPDLEDRTLERLRLVFSPPFDNPGYIGSRPR